MDGVCSLRSNCRSRILRNVVSLGAGCAWRQSSEVLVSVPRSEGLSLSFHHFCLSFVQRASLHAYRMWQHHRARGSHARMWLRRLLITSASVSFIPSSFYHTVACLVAAGTSFSRCGLNIDLAMIALRRCRFGRA